jgi:effector-binding domain-containing protein
MKYLGRIIICIIAVSLVWYFFIKPQDYQITVNAKSYPGTINQALKSWNKTLTNATIVQQDDLTHLKQTIPFGDSTHVYHWFIKPITDSTSIIKVDVSDPEHTFKNKLFIPFTDTGFEKKSRQTVTDFILNLNNHVKEFKVTIAGEEVLPSTYCACVEHHLAQTEKAFGMMDSYPFLNSVILNNGIQLNGVPFIETLDWNMEKDSISFDFCYPIVQTDSLPVIQNVKYKEFIGKKSLKAVYNGNYMTSDRAWYALVDYAKEKNIEIEKTPVEFFFNNPNMGGDALRWKAEVFLPLKEHDE